MAELALAFPGDEGAPRIGDPGLTASETLNVMGLIQSHIKASDAGGDAVLESAWQKLQQQMQLLDSEVIDSVEAEVEMQRRFREGADER